MNMQGKSNPNDQMDHNKANNAAQPIYILSLPTYNYRIPEIKRTHAQLNSLPRDRYSNCDTQTPQETNLRPKPQTYDPQ